MEPSWTTRWRWDTVYSADSCEWCPVEPYRNVLVCGTYQLDDRADVTAAEQACKQTRLGRIYLFVIDNDTTELTPIHTIDTTGILDQKWSYHRIFEHVVLAAVTSGGFLQLYQLIDHQGTLSLKLWTEVSLGQGILGLSVDWSTNRTASEETRVVVSDSSGCVTIFKIVDNGIEKVGSWKAHGFEAWIAAFNYWNGDIFYTGGDDCIFKSHDVRVPEAAVTINKDHEAGVTAVRCHTDVEHQLLTGSYDEKVRLWDARSLKRCITETDVNGGVWRLKWHPYSPKYILAACMYGGFRILREEQDIAVVCEYLEHESIAYGADWKFDCDTNVVATCSFYDCKLHVSEIVL